MESASDENFEMEEEEHEEFVEAAKVKDSTTRQQVNYESLLLLERGILIALSIYLVLVILIKV